MIATKLRTTALRCIMLLAACLLAGCAGNARSVSADLQKSFVELIAVSDLNQSLQVRILSGAENGARFGRSLKIAVENVSEEQVYFPVRPGPVSLYIIQGGKWVQITNDVTFITYDGTQGFALAPRSGQPNEVEPPVVPSLGPVRIIGKGLVLMRILVIGELLENGLSAGRRAAAYVDTLISQP